LGKMEPKLFKESRETITQKCQRVEKLIQGKAVRESAEELEAVQHLLSKLSALAEGEIQLRSVGNLQTKLGGLSEKIIKITSKKEAGKKEHGNVALKCNWNDKNYVAPCSEEAYKFNVRKKRAWCSAQQCKCREFTKEVSLESNPCYESIALKEMYFGAGWDHKGAKLRPRHIHSVREERVAILTAVPPGDKERDRLIIGCIFISRVNDDPGEETKIFGDKDMSLVVPFQRIKIRFWDYFKNRSAEDKIKWSQGLVRYVTNGTVLRILQAIKEQYANTQIDVHGVNDLIKHYEQLSVGS